MQERQYLKEWPRNSQKCKEARGCMLPEYLGSQQGVANRKVRVGHIAVGQWETRVQEKRQNM